MAVKDTGARFVTVACKVPWGLRLYVCTPVTARERTPNGDKEVTEYRKGDPVQINGPGYPNGNTQELRKKGFRKEPNVEGGYALTMNVPKPFWDAWLEQNKDTALVRSKMIFAYADADSTRDVARENESRTSGLEPLNPDGDYRVPRPLPGISMIAPAETSPPE
jgi:hypothetical protein